MFDHNRYYVNEFEMRLWMIVIFANSFSFLFVFKKENEKSTADKFHVTEKGLFTFLIPCAQKLT